MTQPSINPVFISYSRKDEAIMQRIVAFLRERGIKIWLDHEKLIPGTPIWEEEIEKAIMASSAVIAVMSPDSKISEWVRREISLADQNHKQIFPVLVRGDEDSSITLRLITRQYIDMRGDEVAGFHSLYGALSLYLYELRRQNPEEVTFDNVPASQSVGSLSSDLSVEKQLSGGETAWIPLAWALAGGLGGFMYSDYNPAVGGAVGGAIGSIITVITLRSRDTSPSEKNIFWMILAWGISGAIGWSIGEALTEAIGLAIGYAIFAAIAIFATIRLQRLPLNWNSIIWIILAWAVSGAMGWFIGRYIQDNDILDWSTGWALAYTLAWAIAGYVTVWQLRKMNI
jgi:hypothetical protein